MSPPSTLLERHLEPQTGSAFEVKRGQTLRVVDPTGEQVADVTAFSRADSREWLSSGRSIDYNNSIYLTRGHTLYSNRSIPMFTITEDTVGRHDFLLAPCSIEMFRLLHGTEGDHPSCFSNLADALAAFSIPPDAIPNAFNVFMNVEVLPSGALRIAAPLSKRGDHIDLRAEMDLVVGVTACSAEQTNNGNFKPIDVFVLDG